MSKPYDIMVIGGGILGLSSARHLLTHLPNLKIGIIEKGISLAQQQTGNNSGVVHSGIYYRPGSLKAKFCVNGRDSMIEFCEENEIPYDRCGKLIIATTPDELPRLNDLYERGIANGVQGLEKVGPERAAEIEPHVITIEALWSPATAIVDYTAVTNTYAQQFQEMGGAVHLETELLGIKKSSTSTILETTQGTYETKHLINCAGLHSDRIAKLMGTELDMQIIPFRGEYYTLQKEYEYLVNGLIYPVPNPELPFLGVHFTRNIKGYVEAGPNAVLATAREGYRKRDINLRDLSETLKFPGFWKVALREWRTGLDEVNRSLRKSVFTNDLQKMIPSIESNHLKTGGAGVRAQAVRKDGSLIDDFVIERSTEAVHVLNAPSPGATSSIEIGKYIADLARDTFNIS